MLLFAAPNGQRLLCHPGLAQRQPGIAAQQLLGLQHIQPCVGQLHNDALGQDAVKEATAAQSHNP